MKSILTVLMLITPIVMVLCSCTMEQHTKPKKVLTNQSDSLVPEIVPREYDPLYRQLSAWLDNFHEINKKQDYSEFNETVLGAHLLPADSNCGPILLDQMTMPGIMLTIDRLKHIGVKGITLVIGYPMLLPEFNDSDRYIAFYERVSNAIRKRNMKLLVEQNVLFVISFVYPKIFY